MTNAGRIRNMSNEELADWLGKNVGICGCFAYKECNQDTGISCANPILRWLKSEVQED